MTHHDDSYRFIHSLTHQVSYHSVGPPKSLLRRCFAEGVHVGSAPSGEFAPPPNPYGPAPANRAAELPPGRAKSEPTPSSTAHRETAPTAPAAPAVTAAAPAAAPASHGDLGDESTRKVPGKYPADLGKIAEHTNAGATAAAAASAAPAPAPAPAPAAPGPASAESTRKVPGKYPAAPGPASAAAAPAAAPAVNGAIDGSTAQRRTATATTSPTSPTSPCTSLWADRVHGFSSQFSSADHAALHMLGPPARRRALVMNHSARWAHATAGTFLIWQATFPEAVSSIKAWAPAAKPSRPTEWVRLGFKAALRPRSLAVLESHNPGFLEIAICIVSRRVVLLRTAGTFPNRCIVALRATSHPRGPQANESECEIAIYIPSR